MPDVLPNGDMSVEITTLPSGLKVVTDRMAHLETASLGVFVGAGSRHERIEEHGLSHLLEHMAFKGTRRRTARDIAEEIEAAGGDLNAATGTEHSAYYAHVLAADSPLALDILADILTESAFESGELEREKAVILQEIRAAEDTADELVFEVLTAAAFPGQPIGRQFLEHRSGSPGLGGKQSAPISTLITGRDLWSLPLPERSSIQQFAARRSGASRVFARSREQPKLFRPPISVANSA